MQDERILGQVICNMFSPQQSWSLRRLNASSHSSTKPPVVLFNTHFLKNMVYSHTILTAVFAVGAVSTVGAAPLPSDPGASARGSTGAVDIMLNSPLPPTRLVQGFTTTAEVDVPELDIIYEEESHEQPHHQPYQFVNHFGGERHDHQSEELEAGHPHFHHEEIEFKDRHPRFDNEEFGLDFEEQPHHPHPELRHEDGVEDLAIDVELDEHLSPDDHRFNDELGHVEYHALPLIHGGEHKQPVEVNPVLVSVPVDHQIQSLERRSPQSPNLPPTGVPSSPETKVATLLPRADDRVVQAVREYNLAALKKTEPDWGIQIQLAQGDPCKTRMYQRAKQIDQRLADLVAKTMTEHWQKTQGGSGVSGTQLKSPAGLTTHSSSNSPTDSSESLLSVHRRQLGSPKQASPFLLLPAILQVPSMLVHPMLPFVARLPLVLSVATWIDVSMQSRFGHSVVHRDNE
ncbi:hypothetical protein F5880DRAFT_1222535 [Lentinula raphanica]|nr:hypothetical protein F5880DRAFT_1222535 [Lentinula raphanica]